MNEFTCEDLCESCVKDRFGCWPVQGLTAGWDDKGNGIIVGCNHYENDKDFDKDFEKNPEKWGR